MIYAIHRETKEHRILTGRRWRPGTDWLTVEAEADGWIPWEGGECPLPDGMGCQWRGEDGFVSEEIGAGCVSWINGHRRINAYRPILDAEPSELEATNRTPESAAIATLEKMGYGYFGGELWKPPLGERPAWLDDEPEASEWDGEGLPPVGIEVEVKHGLRWVAATTVGAFGDHKKCMVCAPNGGGFFGFYPEEIRPIRTPAQRAEEEEEAVGEMMRDLGKGNGAAGTASICRSLYRAGYRKENNQ